MDVFYYINIIFFKKKLLNNKLFKYTNGSHRKGQASNLITFCLR